MASLHAPLTGGLMKSLQWAVDADCNALQIFSGNPNAWKCRPWGDDDCGRFHEERRRLDMWPCVLHTPYLINLATPDDSSIHIATKDLKFNVLSFAKFFSNRWGPSQ